MLKFLQIYKNASDIGMVINSDKTQLLCVSGATHYDASSYIIAEGTRVNSCETMKILGFLFDGTPTVNAHIKYMIDKFNRAIWALVHLKRAKIDKKILTEVYKEVPGENLVWK